MISWSDVGIVIASRNHGEKYRSVTIFTKDHGKVQAMAYKPRLPNFCNFSQVNVVHNSRTADSIGFWRLCSETQTWGLMNRAHLFVCQSICVILNNVLPLNDPHLRLFEITNYIASHIVQFTEREILYVYVYFETLLLRELGFNSEIPNMTPLDDFHQIRDIIAMPEIQNNAYNILKTIERIIKDNLTSIDNFYRNAILHMV